MCVYIYIYKEREKEKEKEKGLGTLLQRPIPVRSTTLPITKIRFSVSTKRRAGDPLKKIYSDPDREISQSKSAGLDWPATLGEKFNNNPPNLDEIRAVVKKARANSAPGPNGVPYLLYKRCPNVLKRLHKILRGAWSYRKISEQWMTAEVVYISKEQNSTEINRFRS